MQPSFFVDVVTLETGEKVEIRRLEGGGLIGIDWSYLEQLDEDEHIFSPFDGTPVHVPT